MIVKYLKFYQLIAPGAAIMPHTEFSLKQVNDFWSEKAVEILLVKM